MGLWDPEFTILSLQEPYTKEERSVLMEWVQLQKFRQEAMRAIDAANVCTAVMIMPCTPPSFILALNPEH